jgi:hypothetical protein
MFFFLSLERRWLIVIRNEDRTHLKQQKKIVADKVSFPEITAINTSGSNNTHLHKLNVPLL